MKTCFATVIYSQAKPFLQDLLDSVDNQTEKDFDLLIINDNYSPRELNWLELPAEAKLVNLYDNRFTIGRTRIELLRSAKAMGYELVIIGDADDTFSTDRVEMVKKAAELDKESVFFYNKLVTDKGSDVFDYLPETVTKASQIAQENFLGMSTTAIRVDKLSDEFLDSLIEGDCAVFDWYLFTRILKDIGTGAYVKGGATIYRIYDNNEVGVSRDLAREKLVKLNHYENLGRRYESFQKLHDDLEKLDVEHLELAKVHHGYWWSDIQMEVSYEI